MSSFNKKTLPRALPSAISKIAYATPDTVNKAGGEAFSISPEIKLVFSLISSFLEPEFYSSPSQTVAELRAAVNAVDPKFAAKAAIYSRTQFGMRSTSHCVAAEIAHKVKGEAWTKEFFNKVVYRVDDASEILAAYLGFYGKPVPNSLKKGLAKSLSKFSRYQLAKYKGNGKGIKLVDLFNIVHPKPEEKNAADFKDLIDGNLPSMDTWEVELSKAGTEAKTPLERHTKKTAVWKKLLETNKLGYFALLRNLRNLLETEDKGIIAEACKQLCNPKAIKESLVLPFRFMTALTTLKALPPSFQQRAVLSAVNKAMEIALNNVPKFEGETLIAVDTSGSMGIGEESKSPAQIASLFAAALAKENNADVLIFDSDARYININLDDSLGTIVENLQKMFRGGATNFKAAFEKANKKYDRIIILSDMQAWVKNPVAGSWGSYGAASSDPCQVFGEYCAKFKANPKVFCFDLKGYGTAQFPQDSVFSLAGFSDKAFDIMAALERNPKILIDKINEIEL